jgi:hypothetical protein
LTLLKNVLLIMLERRKTMDDNTTPVTGATAPAAQTPVEGKKHKKNKKAM